MCNDLIIEKSWFKRNWKWLILVFLLFCLFIFFISSSGLGSLFSDYGKAYTDSSLYSIAIQKVQSNSRVREILGEIEPMGKMAIINGAIHYSENNKAVESTIKIFGENGKAILDISAEWINGSWDYKKINIRIKNPPENRELIPIIKSID
ncbi:cytochrome c oxidase assembly factor Coa1 family protein [Maribacter sp. ACAM166]|uniref:cytochrome c oxidase assembly factor Coa1 family protein n=1 Tax=Maribacter sp. ACAM166 TaxID=2508996 RepID=UPI0010FEB8D2|nr:cytochrome c oxidase assembly factor Coa1 family protein [Maribacter sp. ACAM166]TLP74141.1 hypothetical protein ES765_16520 [Maribacter sp. ACAM166]